MNENAEGFFVLTEQSVEIPSGVRTITATVTADGDFSLTCEVYGKHDDIAAEGFPVATLYFSGNKTDTVTGPNSGEVIPVYPFYYRVLKDVIGVNVKTKISMSVGGA